jgi:hypothetical protein
MPALLDQRLRQVIERHLNCSPIRRPVVNWDRDLFERDNRRIWLTPKIERLIQFLIFATDPQSDAKQILSILEIRKLFRYSRATKGRGSKSRENEFVTECLITAELIPPVDKQGCSQLESDAWKTVLNDPMNVPAPWQRSQKLNRIATRSERLARGYRRGGFPAMLLDSIEKNEIEGIEAFDPKDVLERIEKAERSARRTDKPYKSPFTD